MGSELSPAPRRACDPHLARGQVAQTTDTGQGRQGWQVDAEGSRVHMGQGGGRRAKVRCPWGSRGGETSSPMPYGGGQTPLKGPLTLLR